MATRLPANLHRNRYGVLRFRLAIPADIQHHFAVKEFYHSLHTSSIKHAADAAQTLAIALRQVFFELRQQSMTDENKTPTGPQIDHIKLMDTIRLSKLKIHFREEIAEIADQLTESEFQRRKERAGHERDLELVLQAKSPAGTSKPEPIGDGRPLSGYVGEYLAAINANREDGDKIEDQGINDHKKSCAVLIEIIGDKPLHELTIQDRNRYDDIIKRLPVNRAKKKNTRGKALADILAMPDYQAIGLKTAKFHASRTNAFLYWAFRHAGGGAVPFTLLEDVRIKKGKGAEKKRRAFTADELRKLFDAETFPTRGKYDPESPNKFWIPLIGLHTGARLNEIAQLRLTDIVPIDGVPCFSVTDTPDPDEEQALIEYRKKSVKTYAAKRTVPIHSRLIELGLLEYIEAAKAQRCVMLFEDLAHAETKPGALASKWFAYHCGKIGLADPALVFHSFRHGAIGHLRQKRIPKDLRMVLVGHSASEDTHDDYGDIHGDFTAADKQGAIEALDFSYALDFVALKSKAPTLNQLRVAVARNRKSSLS